MNSRQLLGKTGEALAVDFLKKRGLRIVDKNYRCPLGEIDIVAMDGPILVFVEVKTRSSCRFGVPQEAVDYRKQIKLRQLANFYLKHRHLHDTKCRFDVVAILILDQTFKIEQIKNAF
jgi:putative endonuclease